ncbi:hypothetical protein Pmani_017581 [Petrolisthes manimaculis]|uniref:Uncharacterized protein n=1 Tax=Petrolisthes manimaculis TaxID=1843537 RepID=A0AAE1PN36_9EUCA|nr:hypothetical protein Pmani_017581 [Petrolisthes manimaculis]
MPLTVTWLGGMRGSQRVNGLVQSVHLLGEAVMRGKLGAHDSFRLKPRYCCGALGRGTQPRMLLVERGHVTMDLTSELLIVAQTVSHSGYHNTEMREGGWGS